jgi:intracellular septation protein
MLDVTKNPYKTNPKLSVKSKQEGLVKFLCEYLPLIIFFAVYKFSKSPKPLVEATIYLIIATAIALIITYILTKKIPMVTLFSGVILSIFGGLTIFSGNELFIKMKPTLVNLTFAAILFFGYYTKRPFLSHLFSSALKMPNHAWLILSFRWAVFFIFLALLNEIIWRNFSTNFWVQFKLFGMTPISIIFMIFQMPFIMRNSDLNKR